jgi:hypothetical protein
MKRKLLRTLQSLFSIFGISIQRGIDIESLSSLIKKLQPKWDPKNLVRIGDGDGGYLVPFDIGDYEVLISPGVGESYEFDKFFYERGKSAILIDPGDYSFDNPNVKFLKGYLKAYTSVKYRYFSLNNLYANSANQVKKTVLQIDIEGSEYESLSAASEEVMQGIGIIVGEFHDMGLLTTKEGHRQLRNIFEKLLTTHFVAHIHINNGALIHVYKGIEVPDVLEITFLNRNCYKPDVLKEIKKIHQLDCPCIVNKDEQPIPRSWINIFNN